MVYKHIKPDAGNAAARDADGASQAAEFCF
jgi:hypothetical protein